MNRSIIQNMGRNRIKGCSLCLRPINEKSRFNAFKHHTLFQLNGPDDIWACFTKHYVCEECMKKLQSYCQEGMYATDSE